MHLISSDFPQEATVLQIAHSLRAFKQSTDQIFQRAAARTEKCRKRMEGMAARMEVLERKMDALEQLPHVPVLHCAAKFPDLPGSLPPGLCAPVFDRLDSATPFHSSVPDHDQNSLSMDPFSPLSFASAQTVRDAFLRKQNPPLIFRKSRQAESSLFNVEKLAKLNRELTSQKQSMEGFTQKLDNLVKLAIANEMGEEGEGAQKCKSTRIDLSESLLDLCPAIEGGRTATHLPMDDPFAYDQSELSELADFDLPEDLPGMDVKSLSLLHAAPSIRDAQTIGSIASTSGGSLQQLSADRRSPTASSVRSATTAKSSVVVEHSSHQQAEPSIPSAANLAPTSSSTSALSPPPAPPPPPPPPPPQITLDSPQHLADVASTGRSDLMAAIRAAGGMKGAKLRKVETPTADGAKIGGEMREERRKTSKRAEEPAEDLMSSLAKALEMRRRGISGKGKGGGLGTSSNGGNDRPKKSSIAGGNGDPFSALRERVPRVRAESGDSPGEGDEQRPEWN